MKSSFTHGLETVGHLADCFFGAMHDASNQEVKPLKLGEAAEIYEQLGQSCAEKKLLQMNAKSYWLQAGLCLLGEPIISLERCLLANHIVRTLFVSQSYR